MKVPGEPSGGVGVPDTALRATPYRLSQRRVECRPRVRPLPSKNRPDILVMNRGI